MSVSQLQELARGAPPAAETETVGRTPWQLFWERFRGDRVAIAALGFIVLEILLAVLAPLHRAARSRIPRTPSTRSALDPAFGTPTGPSRTFLFGVDSVGEDVFSRVLYGARVSLLVALVATGIAVVLGVTLGMISGYYRGPVDTLISRVIDVTLAFPVLLLALGIASACSLGTAARAGWSSPGCRR